MANFTVSLKKLTEKVSMDVVYAPQDLENISVQIAEVNRPGLFLAGYYDYFDKLRLQIMGLAEMNFLSGLSPEKRYEALDQLFRGCHRGPQRGAETLPGDAGTGQEARRGPAALQ